MLLVDRLCVQRENRRDLAELSTFFSFKLTDWNTATGNLSWHDSLFSALQGLVFQSRWQQVNSVVFSGAFFE